MIFVFKAPPDEKPYEIRLLDIPVALLSAACGLVLDGIMFTLIAIYKFPVMLFKGWKRLILPFAGFLAFPPSKLGLNCSGSSFDWMRCDEGHLTNWGVISDNQGKPSVLHA